MKKCPYCAEEIQDEAILCRYCGRDVVVVGKPTQSHLPITQVQQSPKEPNPLASLLIGLLLVVALDVSLLVLLSVSQNNPETTSFGLLVGNLGLRILIGIIAVSGYKPTGATTVNYVGMVLLSFIPIGSWFSIYYAGKAIARRVSAAKILGLLSLLIFLFLGYYFSTGYLAGENRTISSNNYKNLPPTEPVVVVAPLEIKPTPTRRLTNTPTPLPTPTPGCYQPEQLNTSMANRDICVYGVLNIRQTQQGGSMVFIMSENGDRDGKIVVVKRISQLLSGLNGATCGKYYGPLVINNDGVFEMLNVTGMQYCHDPGIPPTSGPNDHGYSSEGINPEDAKHLRETRVQPTIDAALTATASAK